MQEKLQGTERRVGEMTQIAAFTMSKEVLLEKIEELVGMEDMDTAHMILDGLLLLYINDSEIAAAFNKIDKEYGGPE
jgi:hypothetical protein